MSAPINAATVANPGAIEHAEATAFGLNPGGWVALAMIIIFAIMIWKGVPKAIGRALDKKIAGIRRAANRRSVKAAGRSRSCCAPNIRPRRQQPKARRRR